MDFDITYMTINKKTNLGNNSLALTIITLL